MPNSYNNKYITFDEFMANIEDDLSSFADIGHIESDKYIRTVEKCSSFLSVKINPTKTKTINVINYKVKLPSDFKLWINGFICHKYVERVTPLSTAGFRMHTSTSGCTDSCTTCEVCSSCTNTCTHTITLEDETTYYDIYEQVPLVLTQQKYNCEDCQDTKFDNYYEVAIIKEKDDLYLLTGVKEAKIVVTYVSTMISKEDIMIYDHPLVRDYYEYAVKEKILEDIWLNGKDAVLQRYQLVTEKHRQSKIEAKRFVNTPDFNELKAYHRNHRIKMYNRYFAPILGTSNNKTYSVSNLNLSTETPEYKHWYECHTNIT